MYDSTVTPEMIEAEADALDLDMFVSVANGPSGWHAVIIEQVREDDDSLCPAVLQSFPLYRKTREDAAKDAVTWATAESLPVLLGC